jgi:amino acid adenylation domain-containing protein
VKIASLHRRIRLMAERHPDAPAVVRSDETLGYQELEDRASRLAGVLRSAGCAPSDRVAIVMRCSSDAVASVLGVLKAGCCYVPLDPDASVPRTAEILRRTEPAALIVGDAPAGLQDGLRTRRMLADIPVVWLSAREPSVGVAFTAADLDVAPVHTEEPRGADDLAYIVFTGGRRPVGVPVTHGNAGAFVDWAVDHFDLGPTDRVFGHPPSALHLSAFDTFATLATGAAIHQPALGGLIHPHHDPAFLEARRITVWLALPGRLSQVARSYALGGHDLSGLRHIAWCGGPVRTRTLSYWKERLPETRLTSLYGPAEGVLACAHHDVRPGADRISEIPIGRPCPGQEILLLDDRARPVADGAVGRVHVAGSVLSSGYWRQPERSAARFLPHPFSDNGTRVFRTDDLARRDESGTLHLVGRTGALIDAGDHRLAPTPIEEAVSAIDGILDCAVVPVSTGDSSVKIGCAYVSERAEPLRTHDLKTSVAGRLPAHMLPDLWLVVDDLPVDGRGRIDRRLLRKMFGGRTTVDAAARHPAPMAGLSTRLCGA